MSGGCVVATGERVVVVVGGQMISRVFVLFTSIRYFQPRSREQSNKVNRPTSLVDNELKDAICIDTALLVWSWDRGWTWNSNALIILGFVASGHLPVFSVHV